jgi:hypothetical protein
VQDEEILHVVCDLFGNEAQQVGGELVDARLCPDGCERGVLPLYVGLVGQSAGQLGEQLLRLFGEDVFYERLDVDIVQPIGCREVRVGIGALG